MSTNKKVSTNKQTFFQTKVVTSSTSTEQRTNESVKEYTPVYQRTQDWSNRLTSTSSSFRAPPRSPGFTQSSTNTFKRIPKIDAKPFENSTNVPVNKRWTTYNLPSGGTWPRNSVLKPTYSSVERINKEEKYDNVVVKVIRKKNAKRPGYGVPEYVNVRKGSALIINNIQFLDNKNENRHRKGAKTDGKHMNELLDQLGFKVETHRNLTYNNMENTVQRYRNSIPKSTDISIVVIMSHGTGSGTIGTSVMSSDNKAWPIESILKYFGAEACPALQGKPKIFIFQCCRGSDREERIATDSGSVPEKGDMLIAHSTVPGYVSYRDETYGSWYINAIIDVFMNNAYDKHVEDLFKMVNHKLTEIAKVHGYQQTSTYENRGFKQCYVSLKDYVTQLFEKRSR